MYFVFGMVRFCFLFVIFIVANAVAATTDEPCILIGGVCQDDSNPCTGGYLNEKCSGGIHNRCCHKDSWCTALPGRCQADSKSCPGGYVSGLCSGNKTNRCCRQSLERLSKIEPCTLLGGVCQDDSNPCSGGYLTGKCSGGIHNRCCHKDSKCLELPGKCQDDSKSCPGGYVSDLCSGKKTNRCCRQSLDSFSTLKKYQNYIPGQKANIEDPKDVNSVIEYFEGGPRTTTYDAQPNSPVYDPTIGIGFSLNRTDGPAVFKKVIPGVDFQKVKDGELSLTIHQVRKLFEYDISQIYVPCARNIFGDETYYKSLPENVKVALVNGVYRGDIGPKTKQLMKTKQWDKVVNEYLDHKNYKNAKANKQTGIITRMNWNAEQFDSMVNK